jgi:hypothetical protein
MYITGFDGAKELREQLISAESAETLRGMLAQAAQKRK